MSVFCPNNSSSSCEYLTKVISSSLSTYLELLFSIFHHNEVSNFRFSIFSLLAGTNCTQALYGN